LPPLPPLLLWTCAHQHRCLQLHLLHALLALLQF
jgi:hypothetical protein